MRGSLTAASMNSGRLRRSATRALCVPIGQIVISVNRLLWPTTVRTPRWRSARSAIYADTLRGTIIALVAHFRPYGAGTAFLQRLIPGILMLRRDPVHVPADHRGPVALAPPGQDWDGRTPPARALLRIMGGLPVRLRCPAALRAQGTGRRLVTRTLVGNVLHRGPPVPVPAVPVPAGQRVRHRAIKQPWLPAAALTLTAAATGHRPRLSDSGSWLVVLADITRPIRQNRSAQVTGQQISLITTAAADLAPIPLYPADLAPSAPPMCAGCSPAGRTDEAVLGTDMFRRRPTDIYSGRTANGHHPQHSPKLQPPMTRRSADCWPGGRERDIQSRHVRALRRVGAGRVRHPALRPGRAELVGAVHLVTQRRLLLSSAPTGLPGHRPPAGRRVRHLPRSCGHLQAGCSAPAPSSLSTRAGRATR